VSVRQGQVTPPDWHGYKRLGVAVILSAVRDLDRPARAGGRAVEERASARAFLTASNSNLTFWCRVADFDRNAILRKYCPAGTAIQSSCDESPLGVPAEAYEE